ncbi:putative leucine-rich repeat receptor-like serine/threonine-protein kinase At2g19230 [Fagus crenata]
MDGAPKLALLLKAWLPFVLAIAILRNSRLAAGNNQNARRKLNDEIPDTIPKTYKSATGGSRKPIAEGVGEIQNLAKKRESKSVGNIIYLRKAEEESAIEAVFSLSTL